MTKPSAVNALARSIDEHVGTRLRRARELRRLTQTSLGRAVGVAFQQIQKYETAAVRVSAGRLFEFSKVLNVPIAYFYADISDADHEHLEGMAEIIDLTTLTAAKADAVQRIINAADTDAETIRALLFRLQQDFAASG